MRQRFNKLINFLKFSVAIGGVTVLNVALHIKRLESGSSLCFTAVLNLLRCLCAEGLRSVLNRLLNLTTQVLTLPIVCAPRSVNDYFFFFSFCI